LVEKQVDIPFWLVDSSAWFALLAGKKNQKSA
jgi:hypothetical protein